jgi:Rap guanine nucleotide exchange factor 1
MDLSHSLLFQNLVSLAQDQIANRESSCKALINHNHHTTIMDRTSSYAADLPHRSSLPDIPLTPRERQILEQTSLSVLDRHGHGSVPHSQSSESILNDVSPPPKPPLPGRYENVVTQLFWFIYQLFVSRTYILL